MEDQIVKELTFNHKIDKVWTAISDASEISKWFIHADFKAEVGYEYVLTATEEHGKTQIKGKVLEATPYTLKYSWIAGEASVETYVTWSLEEIEGGTKLTLVHSGISHLGGQSAIEAFQHFNAGWDACLAVLPKYLNDEETQPAH